MNIFIQILQTIMARNNKEKRKEFFALRMILLLFILSGSFLFTQAQVYQYSSGYIVNTDVTGGSFYDGGGPSAAYSSSDSYTVTFIAPSGYNLSFHFTEFLIVNTGVLSIYDGLTADPATLIGDFSFTNPIGDAVWTQTNSQRCSPYILSAGRALTFVFNANGTSTGDPRGGWQAQIETFPSYFKQSNIDEISGQTIIYEGYFFDDGGFEDRYSTTDYEVTFQAPTNHILKLNFLFYDITGNNDKLDIYDGPSTASTRIARLQGNSDPVTYYSTGEYFTIDWRAISSNPTIRGWVAKLEAISVTCGEYILASDLGTVNTDCGLFFDSGDKVGNYGNSEDYTVTFCSDNGLPVTLNFYDYFIGAGDNLNVYDGSDETAPQLNFTTLSYFDETNVNDKYITSSGSCITVNFTTDNGSNEMGWDAKILTQPHVTNNDICDAQALTIYPARILDNFNNVYATQSTVTEPSCVTTSGDFIKDVWFYLTVPGDGLFTVDIESSTLRNQGAALYTGSCNGTLTEEICSINDAISFNQDDLVSSVSSGDTIFVRAWGESGEAGTFQIGTYTPVAISCSDANYYTIEKQSTLAYVDLTGAGDSDFSPAPSCGDYGRTSPFGDVWFKFTVPESQELLFKTQKGNLDDINFAVYSGAGCASLTEAFCYANAETADYLYDASSHTVGDTLWVVYWGDKFNTNIGDYQFSIHDPEPQGNFPCGAELFNVSGEASFIYYDNTGADDSGEADPGCSWTSGDKDMWFKFVAPEDGKATVKTVGGSLLDIGLAIYSGTCSSLTFIQCTTSNGLGEINLPLTGLTAGDSIFVRTYGLSGNYGIYGLSISVENPDGPCDANLLTVQDYSPTSSYTFQGFSTTSNSASGIAMPNCGTSQDAANDIDIWFNALVPASGQIGFLTQNETMPVINMALYDGNTCSTPNYLNCTSGSGDLNLELTGQTPGDTIRVRIWADFTQTGYFEIAVYDAGATVEIIGISANYCYSETVSNYAIAGSPLSGTFTPSAGVVFTDNGDGTGTLYIGGDSTQWGDHSLDYTFGGSTATSNFRVAPSYIPTTNVDTITICDGDTPTNFTASGGTGATFYWYDDVALTSLIHTGATLAPPLNTYLELTAGDPLDEYNYYVVQDVESCTSDDKMVLYQIYKIPETGPTHHIDNTWGN